MKNKIVLVTGATNGIGKMAALELARMGAELVLVARSQSKLDETAQEIRAQTNNHQVQTIRADLSSLREIRNAVGEFLDRWDRLDVLLNNAGALFLRRQESIDGHEMTFALNHLNYFLLTDLLLATLEETARKEGEARIVNVSSGLHAKAHLDFEDLQDKKSYSGMAVYSRSKLMNVLFTYELARRLEGTSVTSNALEPGVVRTGFGRNNGRLASHLVMPIIQMFAKSPQQGAETSVYLASSPEVKEISGKYWEDRQQKLSSETSREIAVQQRLWSVSQELVGWTQDPAA